MRAVGCAVYYPTMRPLREAVGPNPCQSESMRNGARDAGTVNALRVSFHNGAWREGAWYSTCPSTRTVARRCKARVVCDTKRRATSSPARSGEARRMQ